MAFELLKPVICPNCQVNGRITSKLMYYEEAYNCTLHAAAVQHFKTSPSLAFYCALFNWIEAFRLKQQSLLISYIASFAFFTYNVVSTIMLQVSLVFAVLNFALIQCLHM
jgi:hypothetical protein